MLNDVMLSAYSRFSSDALTWCPRSKPVFEYVRCVTPFTQHVWNASHPLEDSMAAPGAVM
jgi:hypothetical protein